MSWSAGGFVASTLRSRAKPDPVEMVGRLNAAALELAFEEVGRDRPPLDPHHSDCGDEKKQEKVYPGVVADKIDRVTVKSAAGDETSLEKQGTAWQVTQRPADAPSSGV